MEEGAYIVKTKNYRFRMEVSQYESDYSILFGDPGNPEEAPCIELTYEAITPRTIKLDGVLHDKRCSIDKNLQKGSGCFKQLSKLSLSIFQTFKLFTSMMQVDLTVQVDNMSIFVIIAFYDMVKIGMKCILMLK